MIDPGELLPGPSARSRRARLRARRSARSRRADRSFAPAPSPSLPTAAPLADDHPWLLWAQASSRGEPAPPAAPAVEPPPRPVPHPSVERVWHPDRPPAPGAASSIPAPEALPPVADAPIPPRVEPSKPWSFAPRPLRVTGDDPPTSPAAAGTLTLDADHEAPLPADDTPPGAAKRSSKRNAVEWVVIIGAALVAALVIKTYLLQAFYIPSSSMEPTLNVEDRVLVNKLSYRLHDVNRGDLVVFERPPNDVGEIRDLIKRVIALSGETVEGKDGTVYVNGRPLREPYLPAGTVTAQFGPKTIPRGYVWVMGDNRSNSSDSRVFGVVSEDRIVGRAFVRVWPVPAFGLL